MNAAARSASIGKRSATARSASVTTGSIFRDVGDFEADLIRSAPDGETVWAEWDWQGALYLKPVDFEKVMLKGLDDRLKLAPVASEICRSRRVMLLKRAISARAHEGDAGRS